MRQIAAGITPIVLIACIYLLVEELPESAKRPASLDIQAPEVPEIEKVPFPEQVRPAPAAKNVFKSDKEVPFDDVVG